MPRLIIVSNRLPLSLTREGGEVRLEQSAGGLATGLTGPHERLGGLWVGWPGSSEALSEDERARIARQLTDHRAVPVWLDPDDVKRFYEGFSNGVLWPLFHYLIDQVPLRVRDWGAYERVNRRFAEVVAAHHRPGDLVWVHDYHLMLVPQLVRELAPGARIGFFLHIPFPASDVFRTLPNRERLLEGMLGADLVGFHTAAYMRHFASSLLRILGIAVDVDRAQLGERTVRLGVFPMGIDAGRFARLGADPEVAREVSALRLRRLRRPAGDRPPRLHEGHPAASPRLRPPTAPASVAARARSPDPGGGPFAHPHRGLPEVPALRGCAGGPPEQPLPRLALGPGALRLPEPVRARARGALPCGGRDAGHAGAGRHEPGGEGIRRGAHGRGRGPRAERVRRCRRRARRGPPREPLRRGPHVRDLLSCPEASCGGTTGADAGVTAAGPHLRPGALGGTVPWAPGSGGLRGRAPAPP